mgnify:CR=1 FL=1
MGKITVTSMGQAGVNVDKNPLELDDNEVVQAQNVISAISSLRKRPGLIAFNTAPTAGVVLGGADVPLLNLLSGSKTFLIGRGPVS